jgi:GAF domain-containing protein
MVGRFLLDDFSNKVVVVGDATTRRLVPEVSSGYRNPENLRPIGADPTNPSVGKAESEVFRSCGAYVVESVPRCDGFWRSKEQGVESAIVVPVRAGEKIIGTIQLGTHTPRKLKPEDICLFTAIGNQLSIAVQKSKLSETTP